MPLPPGIGPKYAPDSFALGQGMKLIQNPSVSTADAILRIKQPLDLIPKTTPNVPRILPPRAPITTAPFRGIPKAAPGLFGRLWKPVSRIAGPLGWWALLNDGIGWLEAQAPGVHDWLRGGWKGHQPTQSVAPLFQGGQCVTNYRVDGIVRYRIRPTPTGFGFTHLGPISSITLRDEFSSPTLELDSVYVISGSYPNGVRVQAGNSFNIGDSLTSVEVTNLSRVDGQADNCGSLPNTNQPVTPTDTPTVPPQINRPPTFNPTPGTSPTPSTSSPVPVFFPPLTPIPAIPGIDLPPEQEGTPKPDVIPVSIPLPDNYVYPEPPRNPIGGDSGPCQADPCQSGIATSIDDIYSNTQNILDQLNQQIQEFLNAREEQRKHQEVLDAIESIHERLDDIEEQIEELNKKEGEEPDLEVVELAYTSCNSGTSSQELYSFLAPKGQFPLFIKDLFLNSASLAVLGCANSKIQEVYKILGGDSWFGEGTDAPLILANWEQLIRARIENQYVDSADGILSQPTQASNLIELICSIAAINHLRSGEWKYPQKVPESIITPGDSALIGDGANLFTQNLVPISDIQDYHAWFMVQWDSVMGDWHKTIEIEDTDLEQEGNQSRRVVLPNLSESISDLMAQIFAANTYLQALLNMGTRNLLEATATKKETVVNQFLLDAIVDYLAFDSEEEAVELPILCTLKNPSENPSEDEIAALENLTNFLEPSQKKIAITRFKGKNNFQVSLQILLQAAGIIKGALSRKISSDPIIAKRELLDLFKMFAGDEDLDFDAFLEQVEQGFNAAAGNTQANPYGAPFNQRPRIRELGDKDDAQ